MKEMEGERRNETKYETKICVREGTEEEGKLAHILNKKGILVQKKNTRKIKFEESEEDSD